MPLYIYSGAQTGITLPPKNEDESPQEVQLVPGHSVKLPANLPYVQRLIEKGLLVEVVEPEAPKPARTRKSEAEADQA